MEKPSSEGKEEFKISISIQVRLTRLVKAKANWCSSRFEAKKGLATGFPFQLENTPCYFRRMEGSTGES